MVEANGISLQLLGENNKLQSMPSQMLIKNEGQNKDISRHIQTQEVYLLCTLQIKTFSKDCSPAKQFTIESTICRKTSDIVNIRTNVELIYLDQS